MTGTTNATSNKSFMIPTINLSDPYPEQGYVSSSYIIFDVSNYSKLSIGSITTSSGNFYVAGEDTKRISPTNGVYDISKMTKIRFVLEIKAASSWTGVTLNNVMFYN